MLQKLKYHQQRISDFARYNKYGPAALLLIALFIGGSLLLVSRAITAPTAHFEAESSTLAGGTVAGTDVTASGNSYIQFKTPVASTASYFLSPTGNDANACSQASPCKSLDRGYAVASPGNVVELAAGTYTDDQLMNGIAGRTSTNDVIFQPASGATVVVSGIIHMLSSHVTIKGIQVVDINIGNYDQTPGRPDPSDISLLNLDGRNFMVASANDVTIKDSDWGPASSCGGPYGGGNNSIRRSTTVNPNNIVMDGLVIHNIMSYNLVNCHTEGLAIFAGTNVTVRNSKFYSNDIYHIFTQNQTGLAGFPQTTVGPVFFENNWFGTTTNQAGTGSGQSALSFTPGGPSDWAGTIIRHNSFSRSFNLDEIGGASYTNFKVIGNIGDLGYNQCNTAGVTFAYNMWLDDSCNSTDYNMANGAWPYVNSAGDANMDYHLTGGTAVNFVPTATSLQACDFDHGNRPQGPAADAGADEVGASNTGCVP